MFVELHLLQNFAPSNLNRNEFGAPKDCEFGGVRRARISSQCFKSAIREYFEGKHLLEGMLGARTWKIKEILEDAFKKARKDDAEIAVVIKAVLASINMGIDKTGKTTYPLFIPGKNIDALAGILLEDDTWASIVATAPSEDKPQDDPTQKPAKKAGKKKAEKSKGNLPDDVKKRIDQIVADHKAADIALFGRMMADTPTQNVIAACQVAHAISTNKLNAKSDYFTAIDDFSKKEEPGASMIGTIEFNSACFYRYMSVDLEQLKDNLDGDEALARDTIKAFIQAVVKATPVGKQTTFSAQNPPSFVMCVLRSQDLWSLANAFETPASPTDSKGLVNVSIDKMITYLDRMANIFSSDGILKIIMTGVNVDDVKDSIKIGTVMAEKAETFANFMTSVVDSLSFEQRA